MKKKKLVIYFNAPITLGFSAICIIALILQSITGGYTTDLLFSTYGSSLFNPLTYVRLVGHVFGHSDINHLVSNLLYILILGPMLEEKYHDKLILLIITTAVVTGILHNIFAPNIALLGASGVVFAFILLSSVTGNSQGIPVTLILVAILWIGGEIYDGLLAVDNISQFTHIIGGLVGAILGLMIKDSKTN